MRRQPEPECVCAGGLLRQHGWVRRLQHQRRHQGTVLYSLYCTVLTILSTPTASSRYSTILTILYCTHHTINTNGVIKVQYYTHHAVLYSPYCTILTILYYTHHTVLYSPYCTILTILYYTHHTVLYSLYCTILTILYYTHHTVLYCTNYSFINTNGVIKDAACAARINSQPATDLYLITEQR
jgi:hypothetical protein